jgi:aryl-alcohol dehydrogenase-like predicted oxidoreductase
MLPGVCCPSTVPESSPKLRLLAGRAVTEPIATRHGATLPQIALAWLLARSPAMLPIPGTTGSMHLRENLQALDIDLSADEVDAIDRLAPETADARPEGSSLGALSALSA